MMCSNQSVFENKVHGQGFYYCSNPTLVNDIQRGKPTSQSSPMNLIPGSPPVRGFILTKGPPRIHYIGVHLYWVSFSQTDNENSMTWDSTCTGFHFPLTDHQEFITWESTCTGFHFPKRTMKNAGHGILPVLGFIFPNGQPRSNATN
jgi:hypothetical protein